MRAIVFGAGGTLGTALVDELRDAEWKVTTATHAECDITDVTAVNTLVDRTRPHVVFNAAAYTNVDRAEEEAHRAFDVNARGADIVATVAAAVDAAVVHYSTDFVFAGRAAPYDDSDTPSPRGVYARSKASSERSVTAANPKHFILRTAALYGRGGRNFPSTIIDRLRRGQFVRADCERVTSPTWARDVARVSRLLVITRQHYGLYNCTADGATTWANFAVHAAAFVGPHVDQFVRATATATLGLVAPRPSRAILVNNALAAGGIAMRPWRTMLQEFAFEELSRELG